MRNIVIAILVLFLFWALLQDPAQAADVSRTIGVGAWHLLTGLFSGVFAFLQSLTS